MGQRDLFIRQCSLAFLLSIVVSSASGTFLDSFLVPRALDPFRDDYLETITRMSMEELNQLPRLADAELLDQLARNIYSLPVSRAQPSNLFDANVDETLTTSPNIENEWEEMMVGGPLSINYMSSVMAIASKKDFSLSSNFTFSLVQYPNSFRTTLVQVANDMYKALYGAHTGMDRIQVNLRQIPGQLKTALKLITQATPTMIKAMLPRTLTNIGQYANESAAVANSTLRRFDALQDLLAEIVMAAVYTGSANQDLATELLAEAEQLRRNQSAVDNIMSTLQKQQEIARQDLEKARKDYHEAMKNVPGGEWDTHAWQVYIANRPAYLCERWWCVRQCSYEREKHFQEYNAEAKQKAQEALQLLKAAEDYSKDLFNQQIAKQNEMAIAINQLANINFAEISTNETIKVLTDAAKQLTKVQEQWTRLTRFFSKLAIETQATQKVIMEDFLGVIADYQSMGQSIESSDKELFTTLLVGAATDIDRDSHQLFLMAKTYLDVSSEYLVDQVAGLSGFLFLQNDADRETHLRAMGNKTMATSGRVKQLATDRQRVYELASFERQQQYADYIQEGTMQESLDLFGESGNWQTSMRTSDREEHLTLNMK